MESKSTPPGARPRHATTSLTVGSLPCGIATPSPIAVEAKASRSTSTLVSAARSIRGCRPATCPASSSRMPRLSAEASAGTIMSRAIRSTIFISRRPTYHSQYFSGVRLDQPERAILAPIDDRHAPLGLHRAEHEEILVRQVELDDRVLDGERVGMELLGLDHLVLVRMTAAVAVAFAGRPLCLGGRRRQTVERFLDDGVRPRQWLHVVWPLPLPVELAFVLSYLALD